MFVLLVSAAPGVSAVEAAAPRQPTTLADAIFDRMTPAQRVGQLFMVSFQGTDTGPQSDIADLINNYYVGGVQLRAANQNFDNQSETPVEIQISTLANSLQRLAVRGESFVESEQDAPLQPITVESRFRADPLSVPLFVAIAQDNDYGDSLDLPEITSGVTQVPSPMALGATWKPQNAERIGAIVGADLTRLGINLIFGPSADVMDTPRPQTPGDLDTRVFGGDPYWVSRFTAAYVRGLREGGKERLAVVVRNFPGLGASDRDASEEIPTVQRSLEQLKLNELLPFYAVTVPQSDTRNVADGLQVAHIRYRGFQGNIRSSTRPVSMDAAAYQALMAIPEIADWRNNGGVTFSESLGVRSVRRFYDASEATFNARLIAQDAYNAGNDVLVLGAFGLANTREEQIAAVKVAINFFQTKYIDVPSFQAQVDASVKRILNLKLRMYGGRFNLARALANNAQIGADVRAAANATVAEVTRNAITLLSPNERDLPSVLTGPPNASESIAFFTDDRPVRDCARCPPYPAIRKEAMRELALSLYGPQATGQTSPERSYAFSMNDLLQYKLLSAGAVSATDPAITATPASTEPGITPEPAFDEPRAIEVRNAISAANWIVFAMLDLDPALDSGRALRDFLASQPETFRDKRVVVFSFSAPYYLDVTQVSNISAYYGVYGRSAASLDAAVRVLFRELTPGGFSPVSVEGTQYFLNERTRPNPEQQIPLIVSSNVLTATANGVEPTYKIGDKIDVTAGPILDKNGFQVPDGTEVNFLVSIPNEGVAQPQDAVLTRDGYARITLTIARQAIFNITARSDEARRSDTIVINAAETVSIERLQPTPEPTATPVPTPTPTPTPVPTPTPPPPAPQPIVRANLTGFLLTLVLLGGVAVATFVVLSGFQHVHANTRVRGVLCTWIFGWLGYVLYANAVPGTGRLSNAFGWVGGPMIAGVMALLVFGIVTIYTRLQRNELA